MLSLALGLSGHDHTPIRAAEAHARTALVAPLPALAAGSAAMGRDDARFHVRQVRGGVALRNARHGLRARIGTRGVRLGGGLEVALHGVGRDGTLRALPAGRPRSERNRVVVPRGRLDEWYANGPLGLEQGFTVRERPAGRGALALGLAVRGGRVTAIDRDRRGARLSGGLAYRGLWAADARGRELRAWMERDGDGLRLRVDDAGAAYPLLVDPLFQQARLNVSEPLSGATAADGDTIVIGAAAANGTKGAAYVFQRPATGWRPTMTEVARLVASDGVGGDSFGASVSIDGATIAVGAPLHKVGSLDQQGAVYVFDRPAGGWAGTLPQTQKLLASPALANDRLGRSVALRGDELLAGAPQSASRPGLAFVFTRSDGTWTLRSQLVPTGATSNDQFGFATALGDGFAAVGMLNTGNGPGSVWIFQRPPGGWPSATVASTQRLQNTARGFGRALSTDGPMLVAGAHHSASGVAGSALVFERTAGIFQERARLTASDGASSDQFGASVDIAGDRVAVGAPLDDVGTNDSQGSVYVFRRPAGGWSGVLTQSAKMFPADGQANDALGFGVAFLGASVVAPSATGGAARGAWVFAEDDAPPVTAISLPAPDGANGWYRTAVTINVNADDGADGAGVSATRCMLDPGFQVQSFDELATGCAVGRGAVVTTEGDHVLFAASRDGVGNVEPLREARFRIDTTAPRVRCGSVPTFLRGRRDGRVAATVTDALSGPAATTVTATADTSRAGARKVVVAGFDRAGNRGTAECEFDVVPNAQPFCGEREVMLTEAHPAGRRVRVRGIARGRRAGQQVAILSGGRTIATAKVARDGRFSALVARPRGAARFVAALGGDRSAALRYDPRLTVLRRSRARRGVVTASGRVRGATRVVVFRRTGCGRLRRVATVRARRGAFTVRLRAGLFDVTLYELRAGRVSVPVALD